MPEFAGQAQTEAGVRGFREARRSETQRQPILAGKKALRGKNQALRNGPMSENSQMQLGRQEARGVRSPRLSAFSASNRSFGGPRVMNDITNVTAGRACQAGKVVSNFKQAQTSFQPPAITTTHDVPAPIAPNEQAKPEEKDATVMNDPQSVKEYATDIIHLFFARERLALPRADYMDAQADITGKMRTILMDWLIEVHMKYRLSPETLHLTVNLIDRYLSRRQVTRKRLQLVGVAAMFIAAKFEEIHPPELHDWVYITDNAYTKEDVLALECNMLATLNFEIVVPTAAHFFEHLAHANDCDAVHRSCAQYVLELGLLDVRMLQYTPSHMVAAALLLSNELLRRSPLWPESMVEQSRHHELSLRSCVDELRQLWKADRAGGGQMQAVQKKFSMQQRHSVATMSF